MFNKLKQFKDLRSQAKQVQSTLSEIKADGTASWGKVKVTMDGNQTIIGVSIDPELLAADKKQAVEQGVKDAINDASKQIRDVMMKKMRSGELKMPDLGGMM